MRTGHSGKSPSIIAASRTDINVTEKPSTLPSFSDIVVRFPQPETSMSGVVKYLLVPASAWLGNRAAEDHACAAGHRRG